MRSVTRAVMTAAAMLAMAGPALAQDWKADRAAGRIGEQWDGYLGVVGAGNAQLQALVNSINNERRKVYFSSGQMPQQLAQITGCNKIDALGAGEMFQTPAGQWKRRGTGALTVPDVLPICLQRAN